MASRSGRLSVGTVQLIYQRFGDSVLLVTTSPLWVALAAPLVLGEPVPRRLAVGVATAFVGAAVIGGGDLSLGAGHLVGDLLALGGALAAAAYFLIGRQARARVRLVSYVTLVYGVAAAVLTVAALLARTQMTGFAPETWMALVLLGVVPQVIGHSTFNWALGRLRATYVAGTVLGEAVGSTALAWIVLDERPPDGALLGGALVLLGMAVFLGSDEGR
jgi:drug/metabolite transporter (DMT)-like permease